jgi:hypothetical protein
MKVVDVDIETLIPDPENARTHDDKNLAAIRGSIKQFDVVEPLVVWKKNNVVLGGNGRLDVMKKMGFKTAPVHYVDLDDKKAKALALALNRTAELADWNMDRLKEQLAEIDDPELIGFDEDFVKFDDDPTSTAEQDENYSRKIETPIYEITGEKPEIKDLIDTSKSEELLNRISKIDISDEIRIFLEYAAQRHNVFNYQNIAEYYAHSPKEVQELMEESALIIIDFNKAIEGGFVEMSEKLANSFRNEKL